MLLCRGSVFRSFLVRVVSRSVICGDWGLHVFLTILAVDTTLGPLLTLVVFKPGKRGLKFDLAVIALAQISALTYGVFTLFEGCPVYVAALGPRFEVIQASEIDPPDLAEAKTGLPLWGPKWVGVREAEDSETGNNMIFRALAGVD